MAYGKLELKIETVNVATRLVEMHGGTLRAESRGPGQGAMFEVSLPFSGSDNRA